MRIHIYPTEHFSTVVDGGEFRQWEGIAEDGSLCTLLVRVVNVGPDQRQDLYRQHLQAVPGGLGEHDHAYV